MYICEGCLYFLLILRVLIHIGRLDFILMCGWFFLFQTITPYIIKGIAFVLKTTKFIDIKLKHEDFPNSYFKFVSDFGK